MFGVDQCAAVGATAVEGRVVSARMLALGRHRAVTLAACRVVVRWRRPDGRVRSRHQSSARSDGSPTQGARRCGQGRVVRHDVRGTARGEPASAALTAPSTPRELASERARGQQPYAYERRRRPKPYRSMLARPGRPAMAPPASRPWTARCLRFTAGPCAPSGPVATPTCGA